MPDADAIRATIQNYVTLFSAGDREGWLDLFAEGSTMEDPVGTPLKTGREEIGAFFDQGRKAADAVELRPTAAPIVVGNQAAFAFEVRPTLGENTMVIPAIDVMTFDDEARITSQRAFVDFTMLRPAD